MGGASRFILLLSTPLSLLHPRRPSSLFRLTRHSRISLAPLPAAPHHLPLGRPPQPLLPLNSSQHFHTQTLNNTLVPENHSGDDWNDGPWREWSHLVESLSTGGGCSDGRIIVPDDAFVVEYENLPDEFVRGATACLAFARDRPDILGLLSRRDIEVLVENGTPFLFKSGLQTEKRMRSFLSSSGSSVVEYDKLQTVDLMKYILSYASNPAISSERKNLYNREVVESSVRYLLRELADLSSRLPSSDITAGQHQVSGRYGQTPRLVRSNVEMKRGDWICPKCSFMNFARNIKCLECEEPRPKRELTGGEWDCPQCDFFNYGRNLACLRCDCKRPGEASFRSVNRSNYGDQNNLHNDGTHGSYNSPSRGTNKTLDTSTSHGLDKILGHTVMSGIDNKNRTAGQNVETDGSPLFPRSVSQPYGNSNHVPFKPLSADMFATKPQNSKIKESEEAVANRSVYHSSQAHNQTGNAIVSNESVKPRENFQRENFQNTDRQIKEKEQEGKSERWFKRVAELHDVTDLASAISDEEFPEIMPLRKGENRFVISKKKDRSLTSPAYKRQIAMEQGSKSNYVPFVPFPPDYFAKKDKPLSGSLDSTSKPMEETSSGHTSHENSKDAIPGITNTNHVQGVENQQTSTEKLNSRSVVPSGDETSGNPTSISFNSQTTTSNSLNSSGEETKSETVRVRESSMQPPENQTVRSGWTGKSLEGSAVKEPDPLDMSEEAKAERWFRRVAQIKDISELSQIPDEDFPSIMPMRKGVNRFVVSKRKTPLERRLTSPQYRKNLRISSSDPLKKETE